MHWRVHYEWMSYYYQILLVVIDNSRPLGKKPSCVRLWNAQVGELWLVAHARMAPVRQAWL